jgi:5-methylcytosine-specific restriction endonuclease McrA
MREVGGAVKLYKTKRWERKRVAVLRRDEYLCQEEKRYGKNIAANTVHHIYPVEKYPELALVAWNLLSLCTECHNKMHDRNTGEVTELGKQWQERRRAEFEKFYAFMCKERRK